jgi:hypothetical protein
MSLAKVSALNPANPFSIAAGPEVSEGEMQLNPIKIREQNARMYFILEFFEGKSYYIRIICVEKYIENKGSLLSISENKKFYLGINPQPNKYCIFFIYLTF